LLEKYRSAAYSISIWEPMFCNQCMLSLTWSMLVMETYKVICDAYISYMPTFCYQRNKNMRFAPHSSPRRAIRMLIC
jgi:hypothetical protein